MRPGSRLGAALAFVGLGVWLGNAGTSSRAENRVVVAGLPSAPARNWQPGPMSGPIPDAPVRNFGVVDPGCLYRSAQPGDDGDYDWLIREGMKSIVCLRAEHDCGDRARWLEERGVRYLHLGIKNERAPTDEQAREFLAFVRDSHHWPVLIHCKDGIGRASTMAALVRYALDGWPMERAMSEARNYRPFHFPMFGEQRRWLNAWKDRFAAGGETPVPSLMPETAVSGG